MSKHTKETLQLCLLMSLILTGIAGWMWVTHRTTDVYINVTHKEKSDGEYFIYGEREMFTNNNVIVMLKWNSSDVYKGVVPKQRYKCRVQGIKFQLLSLYRNILDCEKVFQSRGVVSGTR